MCVLPVDHDFEEGHSGISSVRHSQYLAEYLTHWVLLNMGVGAPGTGQLLKHFMLGKGKSGYNLSSNSPTISASSQHS